MFTLDPAPLSPAQHQSACNIFFICAFQHVDSSFEADCGCLRLLVNDELMAPLDSLAGPCSVTLRFSFFVADYLDT